MTQQVFCGMALACHKGNLDSPQPCSVGHSCHVNMHAKQLTFLLSLETGLDHLVSVTDVVMKMVAGVIYLRELENVKDVLGGLSFAGKSLLHNSKYTDLQREIYKENNLIFL